MSEVKEKLTELIEQAERKNPDCEIFPYILAEELAQNGVTIQQWISVDDRLPEFVKVEKYDDLGNVATSVRVLCSCLQKDGKQMVKEGYCQRWLDGSGAVWWKIPGTINKVTHWMPLPAPPKGVQ